MSVPVFKELDKSAKDLITKGFPVDSHGFEVEGTAAEGVKFKATGTHTHQNLAATSEITKTFGTGLTGKAVAKVDKNLPTYTVEAAYEPEKVAGLKLTLNAECAGSAEGQKESHKLTALYKRGGLTFEESFGYSRGVLSVTSSLSVQQKSIIAGVQALASAVVHGDNKKHSLDAYAVRVGFVPNKELQVIAAYDKTPKEVKGSTTVFYKKDKIEAAGEVSVPIAHGEGLKVPSFTFALSHAFDAKTTLKGKVATGDNSVALAIKHQLSDNLAVTLGSVCSCSCKEESAVTHKHGVLVNLKL